MKNNINIVDNSITELIKESPLDKSEKEFVDIISKGGEEAKLLLHHYWKSLYYENPVTAHEFLHNVKFTGEIGSRVGKKLKEDFCTYYHGVFRLIFFAGALGWGKNTLGRLLVSLEVYRILNLKQPQEFYKQDKSSNIYINVFSTKSSHAEEGIFHDIKKICDSGSYFKERRVKGKLEGKIIFKLGEPEDVERGNLIIHPLAPTEDNAIGKDVVLNVMDEANFLAEVDNSKRAQKGLSDKSYRQAESIFNASIARVESRMLDADGQAAIPAKFIVLSSQKYFGDFVNRQLKIYKDNPNVYVLKYMNWETKDWYPAKVKSWSYLNISPGEEPLITDVPHTRFEEQIKFPSVAKHIAETQGMNCFLTDFIGWARAGKNRFYSDSVIIRCLDRNLVNGFSPDTIIGDEELSSSVRIGVDENSRNKPHTIAVDLASTECNAGLSVLQLRGFKEIKFHDGYSTSKFIYPVIRFTHLLTIPPPEVGEIDFAQIRLIIEALCKHIKVVGITYDGYQSRDSIQYFAKKKRNAMRISTDAAGGPDYTMRRLMNYGLISYPHNKMLEKEMEESLENTGKLRLVNGGSTDLIKSMAGNTQCMWDWFHEHRYHEGLGIPYSTVNSDRLENFGKISDIDNMMSM